MTPYLTVHPCASVPLGCVTVRKTVQTGRMSWTVLVESMNTNAVNAKLEVAAMVK